MLELACDYLHVYILRLSGNESDFAISFVSNCMVPGVYLVTGSGQAPYAGGWGAFQVHKDG